MSASKLAASASETIVGKLIDDIYSYLKEHVGEKIKIWQIEQKAKQTKLIKKQIQNIQRVKTLWQVDKAVDLNQFYCDSYVVLDKKRVKINSIQDLLPRKQIIISGIAGQGKSILLRYLCGNTLRQGEYLPVFIELRRILGPDTLKLHIIRYFETIGLAVDEPLLRLLFASGKIVVLLDGFDEIQETEKSQIINEIEDLGKTYDQMLIIITSRPDSGIEVSPIFEVVKLDNLRDDEYKHVIRKLAYDNKFAGILIAQVELNKPKLRELLCTPLLVTLLVMAYKSFQELPAQLSDFFDSIFQVLLQRHDGVKPGYKRPRRCNLNDSQYRVIFECMCYLSKRIIKSMFTFDELCKFTKDAFSAQQMADQSDSFLTDIIQVTCLILKDGGAYRFIHKSVQEYYAASYIKHRTEYNAQKFYSSFVKLSEEELDRRGIWGQELRFLSEIDQYRYNKYYLLPSLCLELKCESDSVPEESPKYTYDELKEYLKRFYLILRTEKECIKLFGVGTRGYPRREEVKKYFDLDISKALPMIEQGSIPIFKDDTIQRHEQILVDVWNIYEAGQLRTEFENLANKLLEEIHQRALKARDIIRSEESREVLPYIDIT